MHDDDGDIVGAAALQRHLDQCFAGRLAARCRDNVSSISLVETCAVSPSLQSRNMSPASICALLDVDHDLGRHDADGARDDVAPRPGQRLLLRDEPVVEQFLDFGMVARELRDARRRGPVDAAVARPDAGELLVVGEQAATVEPMTAPLRLIAISWISRLARARRSSKRARRSGAELAMPMVPDARRWPRWRPRRRRVRPCRRRRPRRRAAGSIRYGPR